MLKKLIEWLDTEGKTILQNSDSNSAEAAMLVIEIVREKCVSLLPEESKEIDEIHKSAYNSGYEDGKYPW